MASISFFSEKIPFKLSNSRKNSNWLKRVCLFEKQPLGSIEYVFCSDDYLLALNKQYLNHATYTDILSFDFSENGHTSGEIYISIRRVRENARNYEQPFEVELRLGQASIPEDILVGTSARIEHDGDEAVVRFSTQNQSCETALNSDVTNILTTLERHAVSVRSIRTHEPNLERLFLKLTGNRLRD